MLASEISAGWKSFTIQLQFYFFASPKILFCHSCDESPASFTFLSEIHAEENWKKLDLHDLSLDISINFFNLHLYVFQLLWKWKQNGTAQCSLYLLICPCCLSYLPFLFSDVCCCSICLDFFLTTFPGCLGVLFAVISLLHWILCENLLWHFFASHSGFS